MTACFRAATEDDDSKGADFWSRPLADDKSEKPKGADAAEAEERRKGIERLREELTKLDTAPCRTTLYFRNLGLFGDDWHITCPGCGAMPADKLFPKMLIEQVDGFSVDGKLTVTDFLRYSGDCR